MRFICLVTQNHFSDIKLCYIQANKVYKQDVNCETALSVADNTEEGGLDKDSSQTL
jgi:hypothetical protein